MAQVSNAFKLLLATLMITFGAFDTIVYKTQNKQIVVQGHTQKYFFHPFMQVAAMFLGQTLALLVYFIIKWKDPEAHKQKQEQAIAEGKQLQFNKFKIAIPALCDTVGSTLQLFALNFTAGSIYQMMRGGTIVTTFLFSIILLKLRPKRYQMLGSFMAFVGIGVVGATAMVFADSESIDAPAGLQFAGYLMLIASLFANGFQFTYEQTLFDRYHIDPLQLVGYEGIFALSTVSVIIVILNYVPCSFGIDACAISTDNQLFIEQTRGYFISIGSTGLLLSFAILGVFSITIFNVCSVSVTKYINALARSICDVSRTILIWLTGLIITVTLGASKDNYKWQSLIAKEIVLQSIGFLMVIGGNLLYNRIIKFQCLEPIDDQGTCLFEQEQNPLVKDGQQQANKEKVDSQAQT